jgi:hypothetical protein
MIASIVVGIIALWGIAMIFSIPFLFLLNYFDMEEVTNASWFTIMIYLMAVWPAYFVGKSFLNVLKTESHMTFWWIARGGIILGGIGLIGGMTIPILLGIGGNQGPILGIVITGPGGLLIGSFAGFLAKWRHNRK